MHDIIIRQFHIGSAQPSSVPPTTCSSNGFKTVESKASSLVQTPIKKRRSTSVNHTHGGFETFCSKAFRSCGSQDGCHPRNPTRYHQRDLRSPRCGFRLCVSPIMPSRIQTMGSIVPEAPLPHHTLRFEVYGQVARHIPGPRRESRPPYQGYTHLGRGVWPRS